MRTFPSIREGTCLILFLAAALLILTQLGGCSDSDTSPTGISQSEPPVMPRADQLTFDFSFFESADQLDKGMGPHDNFINAYFRTIILEAMAHLVLAPPVAAFSAAAHTVPVAQPDGSWVWTYPWKGPYGNILIVLRGRPSDQVVEWELSLAPGKKSQSDVWFSGTTNGDGTEGHWTFHDLDSPDQPVSGEINWGHLSGGKYLEFVSREPGEIGNTLRFEDRAPAFRIDYLPGDGATASFIRWHAQGHGSLRVPDYNGGREACWDNYLLDTVCP
jgi:hypothetical protein